MQHSRLPKLDSQMPGLRPLSLVEQIKEAAALLREGLLTAAEFEVVKRQAIAMAPGTTGVKLEPVAPSAPAAAAAADAADHGASNGGGRRVAARAGPEPTCVRSAKRRAVGAAGVGGVAALGLQLLQQQLDPPALGGPSPDDAEAADKARQLRLAFCRTVRCIARPLRAFAAEAAGGVRVLTKRRARGRVRVAARCNTSKTSRLRGGLLG